MADCYFQHCKYIAINQLDFHSPSSPSFLTINTIINLLYRGSIGPVILVNACIVAFIF